jgi:hypothetical protein
MSRVDEMREVVNKLAGDHAARRSGLDALRRNVRGQRAGAAEAVSEMAADRATMNVELHTDLAADLLGLRHGVRTTLDDFLADRQETAADLKEQLAATRKQREDQVSALRTEARQSVATVAADRQAMAEDLFSLLSNAQLDLSTGVRTLLGNFTAQRATMSQAQDQSLAANGAERRGLVGQMIANTQALLGRFADDQRANATRLHETLSTDRTERQQLVAGLIADIQALLQKIAADNDVTAAELNAALSSDHETRSATTASFMAAVNANRRNMAEALANRLDAFIATLEAQVSSTLSGYAADRADLYRSLRDMAQVWREYAAVMQGGSVTPPPEPAVPAPPAPVAAKPDTNVTGQLLAYLAGHPDGVKLVDLEPEFELSRPQLGRHLRSLVDSGKVVKDPETLVYKLA